MPDRICKTSRCKNKAAKHRNFCNSCVKRKWRKANPEKAAYENLVQNARRRKIFCDLTFEEFLHLCYAYDYIAGKGRQRLSYTLDRDKEGSLPGYTFTNIVVIKKHENSEKEQRRRKLLAYDYRTGYAKVI